MPTWRKYPAYSLALLATLMAMACGGKTMTSGGATADSGEAGTPLPTSCDDLQWSGPIQTGTLTGFGIEGGLKPQILADFKNSSGTRGLALLGCLGNLAAGANGDCHGVIQSIDPQSTWFCAASGTLTGITNVNFTVELAGLSRVGACPGQSVSGEIVWCNNNQVALDGGTAAYCNPSGTRISGNMGTLQADVSVLEHGNEGSMQMPVAYAVISADGLSLLQYSTDGGVHGALRFPENSPLAGLIVCFGEGSTATVNDQIQIFTLRSLSILGSCPGTPIDGEETGCL